MNPFKVYNVASSDLFDQAKQLVFNDEMRWTYNEERKVCSFFNLSTNLNSVNKLGLSNGLPFYSLAHLVFFKNSNFQSPFFNFFEKLTFDVLHNAGIVFKELLRIRLGCSLQNPTPFTEEPHVDFDYPHKVALLYFNSCDGDTVLYNQKFDINSKLSSNEQYIHNKNNFEVFERSTPEENKLFVFDGLYFHSSSVPTNTSKRIVMNINYID